MQSLWDAPVSINGPESVLQFGEGVFLRGFLDELFDDLMARGLLEGGVAVVKPRPGASATLDALHAQGGRYTLMLRGLQNGERVERVKVIRAVTRGIDPHSDFMGYRALVEHPALRLVVSNTTEAGIAYRAGDALEDAPPLGFPAKVAQLLILRYRKFGGSAAAGLTFLPCELIEQNGEALKRIAMRHAREWGMEEGFFRWVDAHCVFLNTLVDRIVSGYPAAEAEAIAERLGYRDALLDVAEPYSLLAIEGAPDALGLPVPDGAALNVVFTRDIAPLRARKVRILNGAHTALAPVALLMGQTTVAESMAHPLLRRYIEKLLAAEVIPAMGGDAEALTRYAAEVIERFDNPFLAHRLSGIAQGSAGKWRTRLLPSLVDYVARKGELPVLLPFAFAAALTLCEAGRKDAEDTGDFGRLYGEIAAAVPGFERAVEAARADIAAGGCAAALETCV